eukprot:1008367_1
MVFLGLIWTIMLSARLNWLQRQIMSRRNLVLRTQNWCVRLIVIVPSQNENTNKSQIIVHNQELVVRAHPTSQNHSEKSTKSLYSRMAKDPRRSLTGSELKVDTYSKRKTKKSRPKVVNIANHNSTRKQPEKSSLQNISRQTQPVIRQSYQKSNGQIFREPHKTKRKSADSLGQRGRLKSREHAVMSRDQQKSFTFSLNDSDSNKSELQKIKNQTKMVGNLVETG